MGKPLSKRDKQIKTKSKNQTETIKHINNSSINIHIYSSNVEDRSISPFTEKKFLKQAQNSNRKSCETRYLRSPAVTFKNPKCILDNIIDCLKEGIFLNFWIGAYQKP